MKIHVHDLRVFYAMVHKRVHGDLPELHKTKESRLASTTAAPRGPEAHCDRLIVISASERATFFQTQGCRISPPWKQKQKSAAVFRLQRFTYFGVADGARTHDNRNHNPGLYQLSYSHREALEYSLTRRLLTAWLPNLQSGQGLARRCGP